MNIRSLLATLTLFGLVGCAAAPLVQFRRDLRPELLQQNPNDIAVLKVEDASEGHKAGAVLEYMRAEIEKALIKRKYAPLMSVTVDAHIRDAVAPGGSIIEATYLKTVAKKASEDAILAVRIKRWDEGSLLENNRVAFDAEIVLFGSSVGKVLWSLDLWGVVVAGGGQAASQDPAKRAEEAALEFVKKVLGHLPKRNG